MTHHCLRCGAPLEVPEKVTLDRVVTCRGIIKAKPPVASFAKNAQDFRKNMAKACNAKHLLRPGPGGVNVLQVYEGVEDGQQQRHDAEAE